MPLSSQITQLVVAPEVSPGVIPTTTAPAFANDLLNPFFADISTFSISPNFNVELFDRQVATTGLTRGKQGVGTRVGGVTTTFAVAPAPTLGGLPPWAKLFDMAGYATLRLTRATIDPVAWTGPVGSPKTGPIRHGERVSDGTNSARVIRDLSLIHI